MVKYHMLYYLFFNKRIMNKITILKEEDSLFPVKCWLGNLELEETAKQQLLNLSKLPFINKYISVMPDCHAGIGSTVGTVIPTIKCIIPATVGVDLFCGMLAIRTSLKAIDLPDNLFDLLTLLESNIPHGRSDNGGDNDIGSWKDKVPSIILNDFRVQTLKTELDILTEKHPKINKRNWLKHLGTLGTGNHFIEICLDTEDSVWVMLHSGSRGIGNQIGQYFINKAKEEMKRWYINIPDIDLAYLPEGSQYFYDYIKAIHWAGKYAKLNREFMMSKTIETLRSYLNKDFRVDLEVVDCHHNYVSIEKHFGQECYVTRKGAVSAKEGELGIIPGSMGVKSYIVRGKGNRESFNSCSHGAGRVMSRTKARELINIQKHLEDTKGVACRSCDEVLDESPSAYKPIDEVMNAQTDSVEIVHTLKQIVCMKGVK